MQYCVKAIRCSVPPWGAVPDLARDFKETIADRIKNDSAFEQALWKEAKLLFENGEAELARQILCNLANENLEQ